MKFKHLSLKLLSLFFIFSFFTACGTSNVTVNYTSTKNITEDLTDITMSKTDNENSMENISSHDKTFSNIVQKQACIYTSIVWDKLEKSDDKYGFMPMNMEDDFGLQSVLYLIDIDFDGTPELFTGTVGTIGIGSYDVFDSDGLLIGTITCASALEYGKVADNFIYMYSGNNSYYGWTKLVPNFPSIHIKDFGNCDSTGYEVDTVNVEGISQMFTELTFDEVKALYSKYLGVDYDVLTEHTETLDYIYVDGYLRVPDPENYTKDDIYNCLVELLAEYEELSAEQ